MNGLNFVPIRQMSPHNDACPHDMSDTSTYTNTHKQGVANKMADTRLIAAQH